MTTLQIGQTVQVQITPTQTTTGRIHKLRKKTALIEFMDQAFVASSPSGENPVEIPLQDIQPILSSFPSLYLKQFSDWVETTFFQYREAINESSSSKRKILKYYQRLMSDYIASKESPYRGILIYHGLGAGKTCSAIAAAESMKHSRNVIVLLPASIKSNFKKELLVSCGDPSYETNPNQMKKTYTFISYNAPNTIAQLDAIGSLDHHTIIIDEVHNFVQMMISPQSTKGPILYKRLKEAKNIKLLALSGTPAIQDAFEIATLCNLLRGNLLTAVLQITGRENERSIESFVESFQSDPVWLHFEWSLSQIDIVYGGLEENFLKSVEQIISIARDFGIALQFHSKKSITLFPENKEEFQSLYLETKHVSIADLNLSSIFQNAANAAKRKRSKLTVAQARKIFQGTVPIYVLKSPETFMRRIQGLISYYPGGDPKIYPRVTKREFVTIPMSEYQFKQYEIIREYERNFDKRRQIQKHQEDNKTSSLFRTFSRQYSNFVFPEIIQRPLKHYLQNTKNVKEEDYETRIQTALNQLRTDPSLPLQKDNLGMYSPKMVSILKRMEEIQGIHLIYSFYKTLEGIGIFREVLLANGWKQFIPSFRTSNQYWDTINKSIQETQSGHVFALWTGDQSEEERSIIQTIFNDPRNRNGAYIRALLITKAAAEGVDLKNIRVVHIMDPYWNETLMEQVIGRAVRLGSHIALPEEERTVEIYRYLSSMTPVQRDIDLDAMSTDEYLFQIAIIKHQTIKQITESMKRAAFDCRIFTPQLLKEGHEPITCFRPPPNSTGMFYLPDWKADIGYEHVLKQTKKEKESWILVLVDADKKIYKILEKEKKIIPLYGTKKMSISEAKKPIRKFIFHPEQGKLATVPTTKNDIPTTVGYTNSDGTWIATVSI